MALPKGSDEARAAAAKAAQTNRERNAAKMAAGGKWARDFDACQRCGKTDSPHRKNGICERCSIHERRALLGERKPGRPPNLAKLTAAQIKRAKSAIGFPFVLGDLAAARLLPKYWTAEDRLAREETVQLVDAIYKELDSWGPDTLPAHLLELLAEASENAVHLNLAMTIAVIALPRLVRRGLIPIDVLLAVAFFSEQQQAESGPTPVSVESRPAPVDRGHERNGQVDSGELAAEIPPIRPGPQEQT
jgi:hypothetical protein